MEFFQEIKSVKVKMINICTHVSVYIRKDKNTKIIDEMLQKEKRDDLIYVTRTDKNGTISENGRASTELITKIWLT